MNLTAEKAGELFVIEKMFTQAINAYRENAYEDHKRYLTKGDAGVRSTFEHRTSTKEIFGVFGKEHWTRYLRYSLYWDDTLPSGDNFYKNELYTVIYDVLKEDFIITKETYSVLAGNEDEETIEIPKESLHEHIYK